MIDPLCHAGGWPTTIGGDADTFDALMPNGLNIVGTEGKPDVWRGMGTMASTRPISKPAQTSH